MLRLLVLAFFLVAEILEWRNLPKRFFLARRHDFQSAILCAIAPYGFVTSQSAVPPIESGTNPLLEGRQTGAGPKKARIWPNQGIPAPKKGESS
jgi:hypothetical protein